MGSDLSALPMGSDLRVSLWGEMCGCRCGVRCASVGVCRRSAPRGAEAERPAGGLSLAVEGPSKAELSCHDNHDGTCTVSYVPTAPGDYSVIVRFDDEHIPGSPFTAKITGLLGGLRGGQSGGGPGGGGAHEEDDRKRPYNAQFHPQLARGGRGR